MSSLVFIDNANATPIGCGGGGSYTVVNGVFTVDWDHPCTGPLVLDPSVTTLEYATYLMNVTSLTIPATTVSISTTNTFIGRSIITEYIVDANNPNYKSIDGVLYSKDGTKLISYPQSKAGLSFTLPSHVTEITDGSFHALNVLQTVNITETATIVGAPFNSCCNGNTGNTLRAINVSPNNATLSSIDGVLFNKAATNLLAYPTDKQGASYVVPSSVLRLMHAFGDNLNLHSITLPPGLLEMQTYEFYGAVNLETIEIPASVTSLGSFPFYRASNLRSITVDPNNLTYKSIDGVLFSKDGTSLLTYPDGRTETSFVIPDGTVTIPTQWVAANPFLRTLTIPSSLQSIDYGYFTSVTRINILGNSQLASINNSILFNYDRTQLTINYCGTANSVITAFFVGNPAITCIQVVSVPVAASPEEIARALALQRELNLKAAKAELLRVFTSGETLTVQLFNNAELFGVTANNLKSVTDRLRILNVKASLTFETIASVVREFKVVGDIAGGKTRIYTADFLSINLLSKDEKRKVVIVKIITGLPSSRINSYEKIKAEIDLLQAKFAIRDKVIAALRAR
jgi:hypothetical protein